MNTPISLHPHPFSEYLRQLGRGKTSARALSREQACSAMLMILNNEVEEIQLGAFLLLLRMKEETAEELAGFVDAARHIIRAPNIMVDLDWSTYAGKRRQPPWFLLAALALADNGYRVFMHGSRGHSNNRCYSEDMLNTLSIPIAQSWNDTRAHLERDNFAYMPLTAINPRLAELINLKPILGLRTTINSFTRLINPLRAPISTHAIFHPAYALLHQKASQLIGQPYSCLFKGEGGEFERRLEANTRAYYVSNGIACEELWPRISEHKRDDEMAFNPDILRTIWRNEYPNHHGTQAILGTLSTIAPLIDRRCNSLQSALSFAKHIWHNRHNSRI